MQYAGKVFRQQTLDYTAVVKAKQKSLKPGTNNAAGAARTGTPRTVMSVVFSGQRHHQAGKMARCL